MQNEKCKLHDVNATPMLQQYWRIRAQYTDPDTILFFRLGDFYEMFFDDAITASAILDITLTSRNRNDPHPVPLCGVPYHSADAYIAKLLQAGKKIAICEQIEDPKLAKGIVEREVVRLLTPGAIMAADQLPAREHNFLVAVAPDMAGCGLAVIDVSTGTLRATQCADRAALRDELARLEPREIIFAQDVDCETPLGATRTPRPAADFSAADCPTIHGVETVRVNAPAALPAVAALWQYLHFLKLVQPDTPSHITHIAWYAASEFLVIDDVTKRNLELCQNLHDGGRSATVLGLLDRTHTAMGARCVREWLLYPLRDPKKIAARHDAIDALMTDAALRERCAHALRAIADLERIAGRVVTGSANARDLIALRDSLQAVAQLQRGLPDTPELLQTLRSGMDSCDALTARISATLVDEPPFGVREGGLLQDGVDADLDELRHLQREGKQFIAELEATERVRTGISSLKVRYNRVFGYYIEITHAHRDKVPADYVRKQTLTNAERYITDALKRYEEKVTTAGERICAIEYARFTELRETAAALHITIARTAHNIAACDALCALAIVALEHNYCRPQLVAEPVLQIVAGRHPVVEVLRRGEPFVPNDCRLGRGDRNGEAHLMVITGPNMAGKSTVMRQVGLITLLAHMGSFVPAQSAVIGLTDRIFTRVGASDNLARGQSTFMVEMSEAATILRDATAQSLILIDELGRGTSTYDGISIAWSVAEYLAQQIGARTLFATHYHELAALAQQVPGIVNATMAVREWNDQIIFLRSLIAGAANRSYGIQVAKLAGLPSAVIDRALAVLADLEAETPRNTHAATPTNQLSLFGAPATSATSSSAEAQILDHLRTLDTNHLTPLAALQELADIVRQLRSAH